MSRKVFGIDIGTSTIRVFKKGDGIVLDEKNVIAIANKKKLIAAGNEAYAMAEKAPVNIVVSYPVKNGVIAEIDHMQLLLNYFLERLSTKKKSFTGSADFMVAVPTDVTEVEKKSFYDLIASSNVRSRNVHMVEKPVASALGLGLDVFNSTGIMIVDMGAETTELSVLSLGGIVLSKIIPIGGRRIDETIKSFVKKEYNLVIGDKTSEYIKKHLVSAYSSEKETIYACGRNVVTGLPCEMEISSKEVNHAVLEHLYTIIESVKMILERTPPEISADIYRTGIYLTGGSARMNGIAEFFQQETSLKINTVEDPEYAVVMGLGELIENVSAANRFSNSIIYTPSDKRRG